MPLKVGAILKAGAVVQTAVSSSVKLTLFENGKLVIMQEQTTLGLTKLTFDKTGTDLVIDTALNLNAGRIVGNVKKTSNASRYEIKTPKGSVGIRGTSYEAHATGTALCFDGMLNVTFTAPDGTVGQYQVNKGQTFDSNRVQVVPTPEDYKVEIMLPLTAEETLPWAFNQEMSIPFVSPGLTVPTDYVPVEEPPVTPIYPDYSGGSGGSTQD